MAGNFNRSKKAKQNELLNLRIKNAHIAESQGEEILRRMIDEEAEDVERLKIEDEPGEFSDGGGRQRPKTQIEEFGAVPEIEPEGTAESTIESPKKQPIGEVPMEPKKEEESLTPMAKQDIGEPVKEKPSAKGGGQMPEEEKEGYFGRTKPVPPEVEKGEGEPEKKPGEKPRETEGQPPAEGVREKEPKNLSEQEKAASLKSEQNGARATNLMSLAGKGGPEEMLAEKAGEVSEVAGKAMSLYKKYKWFAWAAGIIAPLIVPIIIGLLIGIVFFIIVFLIIYYIDNNPGTTFFNAVYCGTKQLLGGDGFTCLIKAATEAAAKAATVK